MVDLRTQYLRIKDEIDEGLQEVIDSCKFIRGPKVKAFEQHLAEYQGCAHVIGCGNGTDALQIALMALDAQPGDEVIVPAHTYIATAEVINLLGLKPVLADVSPDTFNILPEEIRARITEKTRAIIPVHLYGQSADMESITAISEEYAIPVIEDNAQAIGADYTFSDGTKSKTGTMGAIGTTSFYPSKNLGCYGDGGAMFTNDDQLGEKLRMIANHGQRKTYYHELTGVNSRLDSIQAAILDIKLKHLDAYNEARQRAAAHYDQAFEGNTSITAPVRDPKSTHVYHQYTLKVPIGSRDDLKSYLADKGIPSMIYYPVPMYGQKAFKHLGIDPAEYPVTEDLSRRVLSLPIHSEMEEEVIGYITHHVKAFYA